MVSKDSEMEVNKLFRCWKLYTGIDRWMSADSVKVKCIKVSPVNEQFV